jgi:ATP-dependent Clp protease ATP-binding subunit ClpA
VRELTQKRVWFAVPLLSATAPEVQRLIAQAKQWAEILGKRVILWVSDKQDAFVTGIAAEFPEVPHRYCDNHFLRDAAKPVLDADSHAKVQMRKKVRGLRGIERSVLKQRRQRIKEEAQALPQSSIVIETVNADNAPVAEEEPAGDVILEYCTVVRGILNDDQGGPLHPPGLRMAEALGEVRDSIQRNLDEKKGGSQRSNSTAWPAASTGAWTRSNLSRRCSENRSRKSRKLQAPWTRKRVIAPSVRPSSKN